MRERQDPMDIGYARVSTGEQNLDLQLEALRKAGCDVIRTERASGGLDRRDPSKRLFCASCALATR